MRAELQTLITHLGRLRYRVNSFPFETLVTARFADTSGIALGTADWIQIAKLYDELTIAVDSGQREKAIEILEALLGVSEEQPEVLISLANLRLQEDSYAAAMSALTRFQQLEPGDSIGYQLAGRVLMLDGQAADAISQFQKAIQLNPDSYVPLFRLAWILATHPDRQRRRPAEAIRLAEKAAELTDHQNAEVLNTLAAAYASAGQFERAADVGQSAIDLFSGNSEIPPDNLHLYLRAYRNRQALSDQSLMPNT